MPDDTRQRELLIGSWTHSHEEDRGDERVFRPSDREFPPARGRQSFRLAADGVLEQTGPGPDDRAVTTAGTWEVHGTRLDLYPYGAHPQHFVVQFAGPDQLTLQVVPGVPGGQQTSDADARRPPSNREEDDDA